MVYENDDDFGVQVVRGNLWNGIIKNNKVKVILVKSNIDSRESLQGDFLGIKSDTYDENQEIIELNINSYSPEKLPMSRRGYDDRGKKIFTCYAKYDVNIEGRDKIVFLSDYKFLLHLFELLMTENPYARIVNKLKGYLGP